MNSDLLVLSRCPRSPMNEYAIQLKPYQLWYQYTCPVTGHRCTSNLDEAELFDLAQARKQADALQSGITSDAVATPVAVTPRELKGADASPGSASDDDPA